MNDKLVSISRAAEVLGHHVNDVRRLVRSGRLAAKHENIRGSKRPHLRFLESELQRYMRELPNAGARREVLPEQPAPPKRRPTLKGVHQFA